MMSCIVECFAQPLVKGCNASRSQWMRRPYDDDIFRFALVHGFARMRLDLRGIFCLNLTVENSVNLTSADC